MKAAAHPTGRRAGTKQGAAAQRRRAKARRKRPPAPFLADQALALLLADYDFDTVLDVGCGDGAHAEVLAAQGKRVTTVSLHRYGTFQPDFVGDFFDFESPQRFDVVWCSHALEHQANVGLFLRRLVGFLKPGGVLAITVPPARREIVGGHLTVWNTGLLLYNLVMAGIDCGAARSAEYGYNVSVIVRCRPAALPPLRHDAGDIEALAPYFPLPVVQGFDGRIEAIDWQPRGKPQDKPRRAEEFRIQRGHFLALAAPRATDLDALLRVARRVRMAGHVLEFGVFQGRSLRELARVFPERTLYGFDSFAGLPGQWRRGPDDVYAAGHFALAGPPAMPSNVRLRRGGFDDELPRWLAEVGGPAALVHVDCDLYESARTVLELLNSRIVAGTILVFDELADWNDSGVYPYWREGEWRALVEWIERNGREVTALARGPRFSGAVQVIR